ncbi:hypothetical protein EDB92DRAFT_1873996 [Lactarius akahatsu]|uniref:Uncharacterized protein n=1 Tax=Lactarius akahatsu TaxID=416441 RepID=A0AAD4LEG0_9AGAM|nr:hypothetical protein EDB92DRAFT_1873996 [Lactarius akahatsu]
MTYFDAESTRTDPIVALNVLRLFYSRGCGHELSHTLDWVLSVLEVLRDSRMLPLLRPAPARHPGPKSTRATRATAAGAHRGAHRRRIR